MNPPLNLTLPSSEARLTDRTRAFLSRQLVAMAALLLSLSPSAAGATDDTARVFRAGAAASNISPPLGLPIVGGWSPTGAQHIHDELFARCLALDDGSTKIVFVVCDNLGIPREVIDEAKRVIEKETGLPPSAVVIGSTHTHSGPRATDYREHIIRRIADGVRRALNNLEPAQIGWGRGDLPEWVFNRRWYVKSEEHRRNPFGGVDKVRMNPPSNSPELLKPAGPVDPEIVFFTVRSVDGRPISLLANYGLHYVGPGLRGPQISADYFGAFANKIQEMLDADRLLPPFVGMMSNGASGDVTSTDRSKPYRVYGRFEKSRVVANAAAAVVYRAFQNVVWQDWVPLKIVHRELDLATRKPTPELVAWAHKIQSRPATAEPYHSREPDYARRTLQLARAPERTLFALQAIRIGELGITTIPAETIAEIGLELKARSPFETSFTMSITNGFHGYLPTPAQHKLGGYETWLGTNRVEIDASTKIVRALLEMAAEIR